MGGKVSKTFSTPPVDPQFKDIGCIGLKKDDYTGTLDSQNIFGSVPPTKPETSVTPPPGNDILASAPFLWYRFKATNYQDILNKISGIFKSFSSEIAQYAPEPVYKLSTTPNDIEYEGFANQNTSLRNYILKNKNNKASQIINKNPLKNIKYIPPTGIDPTKRPVYGPVYFLTARDPKDGTLECFLYFPSMNKNKERYRNYIELGTSHRWMQTLIYSRTFARKSVPLKAKSRESTKCENYVYHGDDIWTGETWNPIDLQVAVGAYRSRMNGRRHTLPRVKHKIKREGDPLKYGCRTDTTNKDTAQACKESTDILREMGAYIYAGFGGDPDIEEVTAEKAYYPSAYFHTYQLDTSQPAFEPYMNSAINSLHLNIMVSGMELHQGCTNMLISPNNRIMFNLTNNSISLLLNTKYSDVVDECYKNPTVANGLLTLQKHPFTGTATRFLLEGTTFNVYANDAGGIEDVAYSIQAVDPKTSSQPPYALLLDDNGNIHVYDNNDKDVTSAALSAAFAYNITTNADGTQSINDQSSLQSADDLYATCFTEKGQYNPVKNQRCRVLNLIAYLQLKGLLKTLITNDTIDENIDHYKVIYEHVAAFNSSENYVGRIIELVNLIEVRNNITIDKSVIDNYISQSQSQTSQPSQQPHQIEQSRYQHDIPQYNKSQDSIDRINNLESYMRSYNILKDEPLYDDAALQTAAQQLPITSQLEQNIPTYNQDTAYQERITNLKSYYSLS